MGTWPNHTLSVLFNRDGVSVLKMPLFTCCAHPWICMHVYELSLIFYFTHWQEFSSVSEAKFLFVCLFVCFVFFFLFFSKFCHVVEMVTICKLVWQDIVINKIWKEKKFKHHFYFFHHQLELCIDEMWQDIAINKIWKEKI